MLGLQVTLAVTFIALSIGFFLGLGLAILRVYGGKYTSRLIAVYTLVIRALPHILMLLIVFFVIASIQIDVLVNNAGLGYAGAIEDTTVGEARAQFETNFFGLHRVCRAVLPHMRERRAGRIVNRSSLGGLVSVPFQAMYCASKFAVEAYTEALRMEARPFGIHVSMIEPGDFATRFTTNRRLTAASTAGSPYAERCQSAVRWMAQDETRNADIGPVVRAALAAVKSDRPRLRYPAASALQRTVAALRPVLPQSLFEYLVMGHYGIR